MLALQAPALRRQGPRPGVLRQQRAASAPARRAARPGPGPGPAPLWRASAASDAGKSLEVSASGESTTVGQGSQGGGAQTTAVVPTGEAALAPSGGAGGLWDQSTFTSLYLALAVLSVGQGLIQTLLARFYHTTLLFTGFPSAGALMLQEMQRGFDALALALIAPMLAPFLALILFAACFPLSLVMLGTGGTWTFNISTPPPPPPPPPPPDIAGSLLLLRLLGVGILGVLTATFFSLTDAAEKGHLGSDTYRRLNLGVAAFFALGLAGVATTAGHLLTTAGKGFLVVGSALGLAAGVLGFVKGFEGTPEEGSPAGIAKALGTGVGQTLAGAVRWYSGSSLGLGFRALNGALAWGVLTQLTQQVRHLAASGWRAQFHQHVIVAASFGYATLLLFVLHTQQDAAERGRLDASTFKRLNLGLFASSAAQTALQVQGLAAGVMTSAAYWTIALTAALTALSGAGYFGYAK